MQQSNAQPLPCLCQFLSSTSLQLHVGYQLRDTVDVHDNSASASCAGHAMALTCKDCPSQCPPSPMTPPPQSPLQALPCMRTIIQPSVQLSSAGSPSQPPCTPHAILGTQSRSQRIPSTTPRVPGFPWSNPSTIPRTPNSLLAPPSPLPGALCIPLKSSPVLVRCSLLCLLCLLGLK